MKNVTLKDKEFEVSISVEKIEQAVQKIASQMNQDLANTNPLFVVILNGSFMFASDLIKQINIPNTEITFFRLSSYMGTKTTGKIKLIMGFTEDLKDRTVIVLEDIVDTGITISNTIEQIERHNPKAIKVATLLYKPDACKVDVKLDYVGFEIPNDFIVGYGLDYDGLGRNLPEIYTLVQD